MLELAELGPLVTIFILMLIAGVVSYGVTEILKRAMTSYKQAHKDNPNKEGDRPWWWNSMLRLLAILVGGAVGFGLMQTGVGLGLGAVAGVLNTVVYAVAKDKVKDLLSRGSDKIQ